ncbi:hypothetical protein EV356DRAFT_525405 [Viridothelium virens]|uniref:RNA binding protein Nrd1 n=1 Tax=Viridothelium virens TaxID=1048519 RepID=A0A6A6H283_VIRVR|nr:hypothetical protein EV356DRAFT_525405 [Viridothelium virens]
MPPVEDLDGHLQALQARKPPGVSGAKVEAITKLCIDQVQAESALIQKIYTHFKKTAATHKLGILYVVDSVTRKWIEEARHAGQDLASSSAGDGTYAAGVRRITELMPALMNELFQVAPADQKEKISKLLDIWERSHTFPSEMLSGLKQKLNASTQNARSFTPDGSPPPNVLGTLASQQNGHFGGTIPSQAAPQTQSSAQAPPPQDTSSILAALANFGVQSTPVQQPQQPAPLSSTPSLSTSQNTYIPTQQQPALQPPPFNAYGTNPPVAGSNQTASLMSAFSTGAGSQTLAYPQPNPSVSLSAVASGGAQNVLQAQLLQALLAHGYSQEQILQALTAVGNGSSASAPVAPPAAPPAHPSYVTNASAPGVSGWEPSRDRDYRSRSRSPDYRRGGGINRRDSPVYGEYDPDAVRNDNLDDRRGRDRGRGGRDKYRQRSPPPGNIAPKNNQALKWVEYDDSLPEGSIKVHSRTLFVGGAAGTESELRNIFSQFGQVQTVIVNLDKRHAFVKMASRKDAVAAKGGMENNKDPNIISKARQTRWGVGFGPRDCSDYNTGISVIPISRLTDADRKWMLTADFGGSGGRPIETGMVVEEPDIEIGAGVSSKAISRRMGPDHGGPRRGQGNRGGFSGGASGGGGGGRFRQPDPPRRESPRPPAPAAETIGVSPAVPNFGFPLPGMGGMNFGNMQ